MSGQAGGLRAGAKKDKERWESEQVSGSSSRGVRFRSDRSREIGRASCRERVL